MPASPRTSAWKWWVCGLMLLATMINYMDRLTLNQTAARVMEEVGFNERGYGDLESAFAYAFALGAVLVGSLADRVNVRWLYPIALFAWSAAGFATGLVQGFFGLITCRFLLGLAEAGHWPCALRTTQQILPPAERPLGNALLQSGAALGAILTPLLILTLPTGPGTWRYPFLLVGGAGISWVVLWLVSVRTGDLQSEQGTSAQTPIHLLGVLALLFGVKNGVRLIPDGPTWLPLTVSFLVSGTGIVLVLRWLWGVLRTDAEAGQGRRILARRLGVLVILVIAINSTWHFFRAWLPLFLQKQHDYGEGFMNGFMLAYYVAADLGSLSAGAATLTLARRGCSVHTSRVLVFGVAAVLCLFGAVAAVLPAGQLLLGVLLVIAFGSLALFPNYYSFSQELTTRHQGKTTGALGCCCWLAVAPIHEAVGDLVQRTGSYSVGMAAAGFAPLAALLALVWFWGREADPVTAAQVAAHEGAAGVA